MIFVFLDDNTLDVVANLGQAQSNYEGIDVEYKAFHFFDEDGVYLQPKFIEPNRTERFFGIISWEQSGEFELVRQEDAAENINYYLDKASEINPNPYFAHLDDVRKFVESIKRK